MMGKRFDNELTIQVIHNLLKAVYEMHQVIKEGKV